MIEEDAGILAASKAVDVLQVLGAYMYVLLVQCAEFCLHWSAVVQSCQLFLKSTGAYKLQFSSYTIYV